MAHPKRSTFHRERKESASETPVTEARAVARFVRISPRKARSTVNSIRGKEAEAALKILEFSPKKAARIVYKVLQSAIANAENNYSLDVDTLSVKEAHVNDGPRMKRIWQRGRGRADIQQKRLSHITVVVHQKPSEEAQTKERGE